MSGKTRGIFGLAVIVAIMVTVLTSLGVWQLQRLTQKHALIAALSERTTIEPVSLPALTGLTPERDEFRRVRFTATYDAKPDAMVYASGSAVRADVPGPVAWAFLPARLPSGETIAINAGFVQNTMQDRAQQDRAVKPLVTGMPVELTGYLRFPEMPGLFVPSPDIAKRLWFGRDVPAMAQALGWGTVAPVYIDLEGPMPPSGIPKPGRLTVNLKDDHLQYAITWFGLALVVLGGFVAFAASRRRSASPSSAV